MSYIDSRKMMNAAKLVKMMFVEKVKNVKILYSEYDNYNAFVSGVEVLLVIYNISVMHPVKIRVGELLGLIT
jgi:hypothetical protein